MPETGIDRACAFVRRSLVAAVLSVVTALMLGLVPTQGEAADIHIVTTTNIIGDAARHVVGEAGTVISLMGPGVDPHLYNATQGDMRRLSRADVIFYHGLNLEGKMSNIFVMMGRSIPTYAVTEYMLPADLLEPEEFNGLYDPHTWMDVRLWMKAVERIRDALIEVDPQQAETYQRNAAAYMSELEQVHEWTLEQLSLIPDQRKVLMTAHDAFNYFGRAYDIEVVGLQGISTDVEVGLADITNMVNMIVNRAIPAIFVETSVSTRGIEAVREGAQAKGHRVELGGELFSDSLGDEDSPEGTLIGMIRHNVRTIVGALR